MVILEVAPGNIDVGRLTDCQRDAAAGMYAATMAGFVRWLAGRLDSVRKVWRDKVAAIRSQAMQGGRHARTPGIVAELRLAFDLFLMFAGKSGVIDDVEREQLRGDCWQALLDAADRQQASEPAAQFVRLLTAVIASGRGHLAGPDGDEPANSPGAWGWRYRQFRTSAGIDGNWEPQGRRIGWIDGDDVLLEPDASFAAVQQLAGEQGETLRASSSLQFSLYT